MQRVYRAARTTAIGLVCATLMKCAIVVLPALVAASVTHVFYVFRGT